MNSLVKTVTWILGIVLLVVGILGFFNNPVLGYFQVDTIHSWIHIISGVIGILAAMSGESYSRLYLIIFGIVYGIVTIIGFVNGGNILGIFTVNMADNYLHAVIALLSLGVGFGGKKMMRSIIPAKFRIFETKTDNAKH